MVWKKIYQGDRRIQYTNNSGDVLNIETLEVGLYRAREEYQVKFNRYILGIFKSKSKALSFAKKWMKKYIDKKRGV